MSWLGRRSSNITACSVYEDSFIKLECRTCRLYTNKVSIKNNNMKKKTWRVSAITSWLSLRYCSSCAPFQISRQINAIMLFYYNTSSTNLGTYAFFIVIRHPIKWGNFWHWKYLSLYAYIYTPSESNYGFSRCLISFIGAQFSTIVRVWCFWEALAVRGLKLF